MGAAGPLVCYQVETSVKTTAAKDFEELQTVAEILDQNPPRGTAYSEYYPIDAPRYAYRNKAGAIPVHVERMKLMRPTFLELIQSISPEYLGLLVPDIDEFLECDPYISAVISKMNLSFGIQILSLRIRNRGRLVKKYSLDAGTARDMAAKGQSFSHLVSENSRRCQKKSETKLTKLVEEHPDLEDIKSMNIMEATNERLLQFLSANDIDISKGADKTFAPRDLRRSRADISLG